jgi:hypothetical protein
MIRYSHITMTRWLSKIALVPSAVDHCERLHSSDVDIWEIGLLA